ncbi:MAG TPA: ABC transporter substrate-binding protein [Candidatus Binatia bacterium]|nr:ABC transporter substrate-binding protein [Candidatus Binatia bacterium]
MRQQAILRKKNVKKEILFMALAILILASFHLAEAQQKKVHRIAWLGADPQAPTRETFRQGLRDLGYVEGQTIFIEWRFAEDKPDRFPDLAAELVRLKVDAIVAGNAAAVVALKRATTTIPIVMATYGGDPVADGIVASFAKPGGNITGLTPLDPELIGKQLELLKETLPKLSRVAVLWKPDDSGSALQWRETRTAATALGVQLLSLEVRTQGELDNAIESATRARVDGLLALRNPLFYVLRKRIVTMAERARLPGMYSVGDFVEAGGLMSYSGNNDAQYRRAATYVDKILKGAKPAELPIEQPTKFELVINLKAAKQIGLTIPPNVLARADRVIK